MLQRRRATPAGIGRCKCRATADRIAADIHERGRERIAADGIWFRLGSERVPLTRWDRDGRMIAPYEAPPASPARPARAPVTARSDWTPYA
ncbi:MAG: hypothetical protein GF330_04560 [Candidatus Eisenbacteria bacterium]|nr:hypothetical protein [Candidatus Eisenbacteria bacterium]